MSVQEPALPFRDLLAYTDYLAGRWMNYFQQNPKALDVDVGAKTGSIRNLVSHIFQVEQFFADMLLQQDATPTRRPAPLETRTLEQLQQLHQDAHQKLAQYIASASEEVLEKMRTLGQITASNRKVLAQAVLHSVHHWAQVAMEVRQAGFPTEKPQDIIASPVMK